MADPVSGVAGGAASQNLGGERLRQQQEASGGGRSFESVLQQQQADAQQAAGGLGPERNISGAQLERMRLDLMERINQLPPGAPNVSALFPELIDSKTRLGMLRQVMSKSGAPQVGTDLRGRLGQVENEWYSVESVMKSNKDLSTTELLGLQARLYQVSQHVEVLSKVVDQVTGGIKTILNTNV